MNKSIIKILSIGVLTIIILSAILTFTGIIHGRTGDLMIIGSSFIVAFVLLYYMRKNKKSS